MRSGGDSRAAGVMLAAATFVVMAVGQKLIGYVPVMVVGSLIFFLGFELLKEALLGTWGKTSRLEFLTVGGLGFSIAGFSSLPLTGYHHRGHYGSLGFCIWNRSGNPCGLR